MKKSLSNKQTWFNKINLTKDDDLFVGIDTHKKSFAVAFWLNDAPAVDFIMPADIQKLLGTLEKLRPAIRLIVYEAGPTGYNLARTLQNASFAVQVVAASKIPRQSAADSKTDTLDCKKLAQYAAKGLLKPVAIPSKQQEAERQLARLRDNIVDKFRKVKIQIKSFLLQHGIDEPQGLTSWSIAAVDKLSKMILSKHLRYTLDALLEQFHFFKTQLKALEKQLAELFSQTPLNNKYNILTSHPGIGSTIAKQFATEIFDPKRFKDKTEIAKYIGLAPTVTQSGQSLRDGPITKTGRPQLRSNLVEASWIWIRKDPHAYKTYHRILHNTGHPNKAITAMARKLAIHLWRMLCDNKPFIQQSA